MYNEYMFLLSSRKQLFHFVVSIRYVLFLCIAGALSAGLFFAAPTHAAEVVPGTGILIYGDGVKTSTGTVTPSATDGGFQIGALSSISASTIVPRWSVAESSPVDKVVIAASWATNGTLQVLRWDGTSWTLDWTESQVGSTSLQTRAFDIAFEQTSGEAIVAWGRSSTATNELEYRTWSPITGWAASTSYNLAVAGLGMKGFGHEHPTHLALPF